MKTTRSILIGLTAVALLGLPGTALATGPSRGAHEGHSHVSSTLAVPHSTSIRWLPFGHIHAAGRTVVVRGQVASKAQGVRGALAGAQVKLYRELDGNTHWVYLGAQTTDSGSFPQFNFVTAVVQNAHYKVVFAGDANFKASEDATWVTVYRLFNGVITDGAGAATLHGHVDPYYTHKTIMLQKRACAACGYVTIKTTSTGVGGAYSFDLPAPATGRWWWRLAIPGTGAYLASYGATYTTQEI